MSATPLTPADDDSTLGFLSRAAYGTYVWSVFFVLGSLTLLAVSLIPGLSLPRRRALAHQAARLFFRVAGMPMHISGLAHLPPGPCILVANHASYLDGVVLKAALPARFCFVIKKEIVKVPLAATLLRRIGSEFVDRFNRHAGAMDARRLIKAASTGQSLVFFPEGTFTEVPGLARFHSGAFATAARAQVPVVPAVIRGTRRILPSHLMLPRWSRIEVEILLPIAPTDAHGQAIGGEATRVEARDRILTVLGEPDLGENAVIAALESRTPGRVAP
jgi:1-acyl-sn-glycerol-3-phosphate acyltransferase